MLPRAIAQQIRKAWDDATDRGDVAWQREILMTAIERIDIYPAGPGAASVRPAIERARRRIDVTWRVDGPSTSSRISETTSMSIEAEDTSTDSP